jgi:hypothetical protein
VRTIRLMREASEAGDRGPANALYALQKLLRSLSPDWLQIGGTLRQGEIAWFWSCYDMALAIQLEGQSVPYVLGPCVFFGERLHPCKEPMERVLLSGRHCVGLITESRVYAELIAENKQWPNSAPVFAIPSPVDPHPDGPKPATRDLLIYRKSGHDDLLADAMQKRYPSSVVIQYGSYRREDLYEAARTSRACLYLSDDDRGPIALAEILLAGCPSVGIQAVAPWIQLGLTGFPVERLDEASLCLGVEHCLSMSRERVRQAAKQMFDPQDIAAQYLDALQSIRASDARNGG